jgi:hypothetical protein
MINLLNAGGGMMQKIILQKLEDELQLTPEEVSAMWSLSTSTLSQWRWNGRGPKFIKIGKTIRYRAADLKIFENACIKKDTTSKRFSKYLSKRQLEGDQDE